MGKIKRLVVAVVVALVLFVGGLSSTVHAQMVPLYWVHCQYWILWTGPWAESIYQTPNPQPPMEVGADGTGWVCQVIAVCYYTQDINGTVQEFCS